MRRGLLALLILTGAVSATLAQAQDASCRARWDDAIAAVESLDPNDAPAYAEGLPRVQAMLEQMRDDRAAPLRYREGAEWILSELSGSAPLPRLASKMVRLEERIGRGETGHGVQDAQARIIADLDRLIEKHLASEGHGASADSTWTHDGISSLSSGEVAGHREWAKEALRHPEALNLVGDKVGNHYRELVEAYFKALAEEKPKGRR